MPPAWKPLLTTLALAVFTLLASSSARADELLVNGLQRDLCAYLCIPSQRNHASIHQPSLARLYASQHLSRT